ncbi:MAG: hypothetical protein HY775_00775 [Acidobacteria bacterium]|nr:hypothetical protein [Acidobacteriota bacterium]
MISPKWLLFEVAYLAGALALLAVAFRNRNEWVKASLAAFAVAVIGWRLLAVVPSWWLYYADGQLKWGGQGCTKIDAGCLKQAAKDIVVVVENTAVLVGFAVAFLSYQKRFPKQLGPGERRGDTTGGYK